MCVLDRVQHQQAHLASRAGGARVGPLCRARKPFPFSPKSAMDVSCTGTHTHSQACMHACTGAQSLLLTLG